MNTRRNVIPILLTVVILTSWACTGAGIVKQSGDNITEPAAPDEGNHLGADALLQEDCLWYPYYDHREIDASPPGNFRYRMSGPEPLLFYPDHDYFPIDSMLLD